MMLYETELIIQLFILLLINNMLIEKTLKDTRTNFDLTYRELTGISINVFDHSFTLSLSWFKDKETYTKLGRQSAVTNKTIRFDTVKTNKTEPRYDESTWTYKDVLVPQKNYVNVEELKQPFEILIVEALKQTEDFKDLRVDLDSNHS